MRPPRIARARALLERARADALLVTGTATIRWLSGFVLQPGEEHHRGFSGTLLVTPADAVVLVDGRYVEQAAGQCRGWTLRLTTQSALQDELPSLAAELGVRRIAAEASVLSHAEWSALEAAGLELGPVDDAVSSLRLVKDADEVAAIRRACSLTDACFDHLVGYLRPGLTEAAVAWEIESWFRANGAEALSFQPIVLTGARGSMPHGHPGAAPLQAGQPVLMDFGCQVDGYRSDMTRTVSLADAGLGAAFTHGLGHGIGLETHEAPMLKTWPHPLEPGTVFTLEPGVYFSGEMGIRIEDDVALTNDGAVRLTDSPRQLLIL